MLSFRFCQHRAAQLRWQHGTEASLVQGLLRRAWFVQHTSVRVPCGTLEARRVGRPVSEALAIPTHSLALGSRRSKQPGQEPLQKPSPSFAARLDFRLTWPSARCNQAGSGGRSLRVPFSGLEPLNPSWAPAQKTAEQRPKSGGILSVLEVPAELEDLR